jgi:hypothetical protein
LHYLRWEVYLLLLKPDLEQDHREKQNTKVQPDSRVPVAVRPDREAQPEKVVAQAREVAQVPVQAKVAQVDQVREVAQ